MTFDEIVEFRASNRRFDPETPVPAEVMERALKHATLAPNSSNMQLWEFHWVSTPEMKKKLAVACLGQGAATTAKELVVVVARRNLWRKRVNWHRGLIMKDAERLGKDHKSIQLRLKYYTKLMPFTYSNDGLGLLGILRRVMSFSIGLFRPMFRAKGSAQQKVTVHKSAALASQNLMMSLASQGFHTCPMEGFDEVRIKRLLGLNRGAEVTMVIGVGKGTEKGFWGPRVRVPMEDVLYKH
jgi:nitroreductase